MVRHQTPKPTIHRSGGLRSDWLMVVVRCGFMLSLVSSLGRFVHVTHDRIVHRLTIRLEFNRRIRVGRDDAG